MQKMTKKQEEVCKCGDEESIHFWNLDKSCDVKYCRCKKFLSEDELDEMVLNCLKR